LLPLVSDLEMLALVGIVDPPRPAAKASIATAKKAGIRVRMITGDHAVTAAAIAGQLGIKGKVITGAEFGVMSDDQALDAIDGGRSDRPGHSRAQGPLGGHPQEARPYRGHDR
jgi:Ca2+-transporting ATPase